MDLGFAMSKKDKAGAAPGTANKSGAGEFENDLGDYGKEMEGMSEDDGPMTEEHQKAIDEQFQMIYEKDPELRKALEKSDVGSFTVIEKIQIIEAYMQEGAAGI